MRPKKKSKTAISPLLKYLYGVSSKGHKKYEPVPEPHVSFSCAASADEVSVSQYSGEGMGYEDVLYELETHNHYCEEQGTLDKANVQVKLDEGESNQEREWDNEKKRTHKTSVCFSSSCSLTDLSVEETLRWLVRSDTNVESIHVFLLTFRKFTNTTHVLETVIQEYNTKHPIDYKKTIQVQRRVLLLLKKWLQLYAEDFHGNARLNIELRAFLTVITWDDPTKMMQCRPLLLMLWGQKADSPKHDLSPPATKPAIGYLRNNKMRPTMLSLNVCEIVQQITEQDLNEFKALKPLDLLNMRNSIRLKFYANRACKVTEWVVTSVIECEKHKKRAALIKKFVKIGREFHRVGNYNGLNSIAIALDYPNIAGLYAPWTEVPEKYIALLENFNTDLNAHKRVLASCTTNSDNAYDDSLIILPSIGVFINNMNDVLGLEEVDNTANGSVNFVKLQVIYKMVTKMISYQNRGLC